MRWKKQINSPEPIDNYLIKNGLLGDFTEREKLFNTLISPEESYKSTRKQNIQLLSKLKRENLLKDISQIKSLNQKENIITSANKYLWHPYDTSEDGDDWGWFKHWKATWTATLRDNFSWETYITNKRPVVCSDLVAMSLEESGIISLPKMKNPYYWRRVTNLEKLAKANPKIFIIIEKNSLDWNINNCMIWDIITYTTKDNWRHAGIVTEVNDIGTPTKVINARFDWVTEIPFLSTQSIWKDYNQKDRYDGFFTPQEGYIINYVIRPRRNMVVLAQAKKEKTD